MFGIGMPEMIVIMAVALIVIGPKKLPDLAKSLGRALGEFKKATNELKASIAIEEDLDDVKKTFTDLQYDVEAAVESDDSTEKTPPYQDSGAPPEPDRTPATPAITSEKDSPSDD